MKDSGSCSLMTSPCKSVIRVFSFVSFFVTTIDTNIFTIFTSFNKIFTVLQFHKKNTI